MAPPEPRFATSSPEEFLFDYAELVRREKNPAKVATWLFANAAMMSEGMFFDRRFQWQELEAQQIMALRVCAPAGVFTQSARTGYMTQVGAEDPERFELAQFMFRTDYEFITGLPPVYEQLKANFIQLMKLAYGHNIRPADQRVKAM